MDSNLPLLPHGNSDTKTAFRKPSGDAASRNYRRRSPVDGSSSPDANTRQGHSSSPNSVRENSSRVSHHYSRKYDDREQDQQYGRNHYGRSSESLRNPDRQSSKSSHGHSRRDKYANEDRYRERLISRSGHESRDDHMREESDVRSKNYHRSVDKYSHDKYDRPDHRSKEKRRETYLDHKKYKEIDPYEKSASSKKHALHDEVEREGLSLDWDAPNERRDSRRSSGDYNRSDQPVSYSEARNQREDSSPQRDNGKFSLKDAYKSEQKESNDQNIPWKEKRKHDTDIGKGKDWKTRKEGEQCAIEDKETSGKKLNDKDDNNRKDGTEANESKTSSSKLSHESKADSLAAKTSGFDGDNDLDAAKIAAMRAAELVNRNLVGAGCLTTDQKKKLLWGSKKSTPTEEVAFRGQKLEHGDGEVVIIGAMVLDIHATPSARANSGTTVPGKVYYVRGGVARNVAECMSKLGAKPFMISALGFDMAGNLLLNQWKSAGLSAEGILKDKDIETPVVCNIFDIKGEVAAGVASVEALEKYLTPDWILHFKNTLLSAPVLMVDANISHPTLETACKMATDMECPVWFEPVSVTKSRRISFIVDYVTFASPNEDELIAMANALSGSDEFQPLKESQKKNISVVSLFQLLKPAIWVLLQKGIEVVLVTVGSNGVFLCNKGGSRHFKKPTEKINRSGFGGQLYKTFMKKCSPSRYSGFSELNKSSNLFSVHFPSLAASVVRLTGAGDCFVGGTLTSICAGLDIMQSVSVGIAVAKAAVEAEANVPNTFNLSVIADDAKSVYSDAKVLFHQSML